MYERRRARILLAVLTLVALVFITVDVRTGPTGPLTWVREGAAVVFGPVQEGLATMIRPVGEAFDQVGELLGLRDENARLRAELDRARQQQRSLADLARQNRHLRDMLGMRRRLVARDTRFSFLAARVIALGPSNFEWTITVDVGTRDGVRRDMTVVNGDGLVGRVVQAGPTTSRVLLAIDRSFSAAVRIAPTGEQGYLEGNAGDPLRLTLLNPEAKVGEDQQIVTASYRGGIFPEGIPVGTVSRVGKETGLLERTVLVNPAVNFTRLEFVDVLLRAPPPGSRPAAPLPGAERPRRPPDTVTPPTPAGETAP